jgi:hypothetical protein
MAISDSGNVAASNSPINWLPLELLQNIFQHYLCGDTDIPEPLLFVCRHWYHAAISFPILWSTIDPTSLRINLRCTVQFIRARCLRSYPLPLHLNFGADAALDAVLDTPTLLDRCSTIHIHTQKQWMAVGARLPRLKHLVLSCRIPMGSWDEIPTLQSLDLKRSGGVGDIWTVSLLKNIIRLEAIYSSTLWLDMQKATTFAPKLQVLQLTMIEFPGIESLVEIYSYRLASPPAIRERTFDQVTHLVLRYTNIKSIYALQHPLPFVGVPCLIHLEIWLYYLRTIYNLLTFDYPTVTRLTVTMFSNPAPVVTDDPGELQGLLDLMKRLPNLENADLTVTSVIMDSLRAELRRNPLTLPLPTQSIIRHYLPAS